MADALSKFSTFALIIAAALAALDGYVWSIVAPQNVSAATGHIYFLDVAQGASELAFFPGGTKVMIDAGAGSDVADAIERILPRGDRYIDVAIISIRDPSAFGGYIALLDRYGVGAFIYNGRDDGSFRNDWPGFLDKIEAKHIPLLMLGAGDRITVGSSPNKIDILSPDIEFLRGADGGDAGIVAAITMLGLRELFAVPAGPAVEDYILENRTDIGADVLAFSVRGLDGVFAAPFLHAVKPKVVIFTAANAAPLAVLATSTPVRIFIPARDGTIAVAQDLGNGLRVTRSRAVKITGAP